MKSTITSKKSTVQVRSQQYSTKSNEQQECNTVKYEEIQAKHAKGSIRIQSYECDDVSRSRVEAQLSFEPRGSVEERRSGQTM